MLASKNVRPSVTSPEQGLHWLNVLGGELNVRLRDAREIAPGLWPKTLALHHRTGTSIRREVGTILTIRHRSVQVQADPVPFYEKPEHRVHRQIRQKAMGGSNTANVQGQYEAQQCQLAP